MTLMKRVRIDPPRKKSSTDNVTHSIRHFVSVSDLTTILMLVERMSSHDQSWQPSVDKIEKMIDRNDD